MTGVSGDTIDIAYTYALPDGYTHDNCVIISKSWRDNSGTWRNSFLGKDLVIDALFDSRYPNKLAVIARNTLATSKPFKIGLFKVI